MHSQEIIFTRAEGLRGITTFAIVRIDSAQRLTQEAALSAFKASVSDWVRDSTDGREVWEASCQDLNIGDLANYGTDGLVRFLVRHGIEKFEIVYLGGCSGSVPFDTVLSQDPETASQ